MKTKLSLHLVLHKIDLHIKEGLAILDDTIKLKNIPNGTLHPVLHKKATEWCAKADDLSQEIFEDSEPLYRLSSFSKIVEPFDDIDPFRFLKGVSYQTRVDFRHKMKTLSDFYQHIESQTSTTLVYVSSVTTLRYSDSSIKLRPNSHEHYLCDYMFQNYDFEQIADRDEVENAIFGDAENQNLKATKVRNAANEINQHARKSFGFQIFGLNRGTICLWNPNKKKR